MIKLKIFRCRDYPGGPSVTTGIFCKRPAKGPKSERDKEADHRGWGDLGRPKPRLLSQNTRHKRHTFVDLLKYYRACLSQWSAEGKSELWQTAEITFLYRQVLVFQALCPSVRSHHHGEIILYLCSMQSRCLHIFIP